MKYNIQTHSRKMEHTIELSQRLMCDLELLLIGAFAPLEGFLTEKDYKSVVSKMRLSTGELWPMPIVLPINGKTKEKIKHEESVVLTDSYGRHIARLTVQDIYKPNIERECVKVYGADDMNHPYVQVVRGYGDKNDVWYVGGRVECISMPPHYDFEDIRLTPDQTKIFFAENGWDTVVGFQTRNPMHKSHYELTKYALSQTGDDNAKVLIHPIVGVTQECDVDYYTRVKCYKLILKQYPENTAKLSLLPLSMRMAGPREAMWHALIRKNYGCTHFVVGRDHAGPSSKRADGQPFYDPYAAHELLEEHGEEIGIQIIKSKMIVYVEDLQEYRAIDQVPKGMKTLAISGTEQRRRLRAGEEIPEWFTYPEIVTQLRESIVPMNKRGFCIYFVGLSGAGKTTLSNAVRAKLLERTDRPVTVLDGDIVRKNLSKGLGFSKEDRSTNVRRIGYVASEVVKHRGIALCANIAPYKEDRDFNRKIISKQGGYIEVFMDTPLDICERRDVKGLYKKAREGIIKQFTGISDPFEEPDDSEIVINDYQDLHKNIDVIINKLVELGYLNDE
jgi:sulfate adenylyltransferase